MKSKNKILAICAVLIVIAAVLLIVKPWTAAKPAVTQPTVEPVVTESPTEAPTEEPTQEPTEVPTVAPATAMPETTDAPAAADLTADNPVLAQVGDNQILLSDVQEIAGLLYNYGYTEKENDYQYALNYMLSRMENRHAIMYTAVLIDNRIELGSRFILRKPDGNQPLLLIRFDPQCSPPCSHSNANFSVWSPDLRIIREYPETQPTLEPITTAFQPLAAVATYS